MSIPTPFNPLGTLGADAWPADLLPGLIDGWLIRKPETTMRGKGVDHDNQAYTPTEPAIQALPRTVLFVSTEELPAGGESDSPMWNSGNFSGQVFMLTFYSVPKEGLRWSGLFISSPARWNIARRLDVLPFSVAAKIDENNNRKMFSTEWRNWVTLQDASFTDAIIRWTWRYAAAWAAYDTGLTDAECVRRLELLTNFAFNR